jgi:hypothetical protein
MLGNRKEIKTSSFMRCRTYNKREQKKASKMRVVICTKQHCRSLFGSLIEPRDREIVLLVR